MSTSPATANDPPARLANPRTGAMAKGRQADSASRTSIRRPAISRGHLGQGSRYSPPQGPADIRQYRCPADD